MNTLEQEQKVVEERARSFLSALNIGVAMPKKVKTPKPGKGYSFKVASTNDINFQKIMDDLSYQDPLRIVKTEDQMYAVIHHTIYDKYMHSMGVPLNNFQAIKNKTAKIEASDISGIVADIQAIKKDRWKPKLLKNLSVQVIKVKV